GGDVDVEAALPVGELGGFQGALVNPTGAVEQYIDLRVSGGGGPECGMVGDVQHISFMAGIGVEAGEFGADPGNSLGIAVGGDDAGAFAGKGQRRGAADAGGGGGHECGLAAQPLQILVLPREAARTCRSRRRLASRRDRPWLDVVTLSINRPAVEEPGGTGGRYMGDESWG